MDSSPFSRLPFELREQIYAFVLCRSDPVTISLSAGRPQLQPNSLHPLSLAQTCMQLRSESLPLFYRTNHFIFHTDHITTSHHGYGLRTSWRACLASWLSTIGASNRRRLRSVDIDIEGWDPNPNGTHSKVLWASLSSALALFDDRTEVALRCYVMYYSQKWKVAPVRISLCDSESAREAICEVYARGGEVDERSERNGEREGECLRLVGFIRERQDEIQRRSIQKS